MLTIVGGLSLTKALEEALPAIHFSQWSDTNLILLLRLFTFCAIASCFFIGASVFFQQVHLEAGHEKHFKDSNYFVDFACCIMHFSLLYFMAINIRDIPDGASVAQQRFFLALCSVMLYDWVWFLFSAGSSAGAAIKRWAVPNTIATAIYVGCFLMFRSGLLDRTWFEVSLAGFTFLFSIPDGIQLHKGRLPD